MVDDWDQIRTLLKQIQPEDRGAIRFWLREGLAFGEELSHDMPQVDLELERLSELNERR